MKILIMCGGRGKRLSPITDTVPKPLVKISSRSILSTKLERYIKQGFKDYIFCIGYKGELIRAEIEEKFPMINAQFSDAGEDAGILERLFTAKDLFDDSVLMTYGDTFTDIELDKFIDIHRNSDNEATIVVAPIMSPFGLVDFDSENKATFFQEKPVLKYYIGYTIIDRNAFDWISSKIISLPDGEGITTFFRILSAIRKLGVFYHRGLQITFNTHKELESAEKALLKFYTDFEDQNEFKT